MTMFTAEHAESAGKNQMLDRNTLSPQWHLREMSRAIDKREILDNITDRIIGAAIDVHRALGPGLLESAYQACVHFEVSERCGFTVEQQKPLPISYRTVRLDCGHRLDLIVNGLIIVELKSVDRLLPIHEAQMLSYLKLSGCPVGLLINFNVKMLKDGIKRIVNNY